jgi:glucan phosphoethanolaminetransferase (alkaline phosphatase superfamily)
MKSMIKNTNNTEVGSLLEKLKAEDERYFRISKSFRMIYFILIPVYVLITAANFFVSKDLLQLFSGVCFIISMVIFVWVFTWFYKSYKNIDYSVPTITMLRQAAKRYKPFQLNTLWLLLALLLMDAGLVFNISLSFSFVQVQVWFLGAVLVAICIGFVVWYVKYKPLRDHALRLIRELSNEC